MELNPKRARFSLFVIRSQTHILPSNLTLYLNPLSDTLFNGVWSEIQPLDRAGVFRKSSFEFLKCLASTLNTAALQS